MKIQSTILSKQRKNSNDSFSRIGESISNPINPASLDPSDFNPSPPNLEFSPNTPTAITLITSKNSPPNLAWVLMTWLKTPESHNPSHLHALLPNFQP